MVDMDCKCPRKCIRHGKCEECREFKKKKNMQPYCVRQENSKRTDNKKKIS